MDEEFLENFEKEAVTIAQFNHDNIIKVYDIETLYQTMFIVMEHIEGDTVRQKRVKTGFENAGWIELLETDLKGGAAIVTMGQYMVEEGTRVSVQQEKK